MKQYIVVRADLPPGAQAVQACHAMKLFTLEFPQYENTDNLVLLSVPSEGALIDLEKRAKAARHAVSAFHEPDFDVALTSIAIGHTGAKLVSNLPLALRGAKKNQAAA